jgi:hypothetical protein
MHARTVVLRDLGSSWKEIGEALNRHPDTTKAYYRYWSAELVYEDTIHFFLSEKTRKLLQKMEVDTMSHSGAVQAKLIASSYFEGHRWKGVGPATVKEILDAIEDLYDSRANRRQFAGGG